MYTAAHIFIEGRRLCTPGLFYANMSRNISNVRDVSRTIFLHAACHFVMLCQFNGNFEMLWQDKYPSPSFQLHYKTCCFYGKRNTLYGNMPQQALLHIQTVMLRKTTNTTILWISTLLH